MGTRCAVSTWQRNCLRARHPPGPRLSRGPAFLSPLFCSGFTHNIPTVTAPTQDPPLGCSPWMYLQHLWIWWQAQHLPLPRRVRKSWRVGNTQGLCILRWAWGPRNTTCSHQWQLVKGLNSLVGRRDVSSKSHETFLSLSTVRKTTPKENYKCCS